MPSGSRAAPIENTWLVIRMPALREQLAGDGAGGDARGGFARARALEDVAHVGAAVLRDAGEVGMAGPRPRHRRAARAAGIGRRLRASSRIVYCQFTQSRFSIIIAIGPPMVSPARTPDRISRAIGLDRHPAAAAVAALAAAQVAR